MARVLIVTTLLLAMTAGSVAAQGKGSVELGFDFGVTYQTYDDDAYYDDGIYVGLPGPALGGISYVSLQTARAGFFVVDKGQIETTFGFSLTDSENSSKLTQLGLGADWLQNLGDFENSAVPFIKAGGAFRLIDAGSETDLQPGVRAGGGVKLRMGDRLAMRFDGGVMRWFESDNFYGHTDVYGSIGLSFFTK